MPKVPKPPAHLAAATKAWWQSVVDDYQLEPHHVRLLSMAAEAWDQHEQAQEYLRRDGLVIEGREGGVRPHPCVAIARDARQQFAKIIHQLGFDDEPKRPPGRPPAEAYPIRR